MSVTISAAKTTFARDKVINATLRNTAFTPPATLYLALLTADPTDAGSTANELSGNGYARMACAFGAPITAGGGEQCTNSGTLTSATATANWSTTTYGALMDAASGGNMWYKGAWSSSVTVLNGQQFQLPAGALGITEY